MATEDRTLLLDVGFVPLKTIHWSKAITLLFKDSIEVIEEYDRVIRSPSLEMKVPAVIRLKKPYKRKRTIKFSRIAVYLRDNFTCQYCGQQLPASKLTIDHYLARSKGGKTTFNNALSACRNCNSLKDDMTPEEAGMKPLKLPHTPTWLPTDFARWIQHPERIPEKWKPYLGGLDI